MSDEKNSDEQPVQQIQHSSATARIPDEIGRGVFATAVIVLHGPNEYTIDFIQSPRVQIVLQRDHPAACCGKPVCTCLRTGTRKVP